MPYRNDARADDLEPRVSAARERLEQAEEALAEAVSLRDALVTSIDEERRALDVAVANAEDHRRAAVHAGLARADAPSPTLRDRVRTQAVVAALERTLAERRSTRPPAPPPGTPLEVLQEASAERGRARRRRAVLAVQGEARRAEAQAAFVAALEARDEARAALESVESLQALEP